eukprot:CAMPEP_0206142776 /NCGR_PEP_ID=MMETSP1473-20131121/18155_1 /ASSEMBLY_ACC=CAM_ASM_001109 /TAXON_ID=1461547 /ORGANISM="Stichococcus sp, Strain RCC1054" /LENGTH=186 /DNA_ID=CAMNT_0053537903 /DNA_START=255 /DNA_END=815 /DNA_ORIENTATION=+
MIRQLLDSMGVQEYEPRVVHQLLDFMYGYVAGILQDAQAYSERGGQALGQVDVEDVMVAIQSRAPFSFVQPPSHDALAAMASKRNAKPLPQPGKLHGLSLPPEEHRLWAPVWDLPRPAAGGPPSGAAAPPAPPSAPEPGSHGPFHQQLESPVGLLMGSRQPLENPEPWPLEDGEDGGMDDNAGNGT